MRGLETLTKGFGAWSELRELWWKDNGFLPSPLTKFCLCMPIRHSLWLLWDSHLLKT